ncbi:hypothetical protein [Mycolicibacterium mucogenicum]|nr:hypothetical protein [Mycolicibacterium mucogenicum]
MVLQSELTAAQKTVLFALQTYADYGDGTNAHPGEILLAELCGMTTRAVRNALDRGKALGIIEQTRAANPKAHKAAVYRLVAPPVMAAVKDGSTGTTVPVNNSTTGTAVPVETRSTGTHVPVNNPTTGTAVQFLPERGFLPPEPFTNNLGVLRNSGTSPEPVPDAHTIDPPSRFCDKHPMGFRGKCGDCANARTTFEAWTASEAERDVAIELAEGDRERRRRKAIADCLDCDRNGLIEVDENTQAWCTHQGLPPLRAVGDG